MDCRCYQWRKSSLRLISFLLFAHITCAWAQTQETIVVASEEWEGYTNADGTGLYFDLIRSVYAPDGILVKHKVAPYERSVELTRSQTVDAWVASYDQEEEFALYPMWHFDAEVVVALVEKSRFPDFKGVSSLKNQTVSWIRGYAYDEYIDEPMNVYVMDKRANILEMLSRERIDVYLDALGDVEDMLADKDALRRAGMTSDQFSVVELLQLKLYLGFANNPNGKQFRDTWDKNFLARLESGEIQKIFEKHNQDYFPF